MTNSGTGRRLLLLALAVVAWLACFAMLVRLGTWAGFALAGAALVAPALKFDPALLGLLRPSVSKVGIGFLLGAMMILLTHAAFAVVTVRLSEIRTATLGIYALLNNSGFSPLAQAAFVVVVAACEEILFRGALAGTGQGIDQGGSHNLLTWRGLGTIVALAACYAAATLTLGSFLLAVCAFLCGIAWGGLSVATRSLVPAIVAHIVWDLGIFLAWPLV
ncbi:MAG TPA: CPBP family glutamic-type intramembrane protease [Polyangia bacterium]